MLNLERIYLHQTICDMSISYVFLSIDLTRYIVLCVRIENIFLHEQSIAHSNVNSNKK